MFLYSSDPSDSYPSLLSAGSQSAVSPTCPLSQQCLYPPFPLPSSASPRSKGGSCSRAGRAPCRGAAVQGGHCVHNPQPPSAPSSLSLPASVSPVALRHLLVLPWTLTSFGAGPLLFVGSEPEQHCLLPAGQSDEGASKGRATRECPCGEEGPAEGTVDAGLGGRRGEGLSLQGSVNLCVSWRVWHLGHVHSFACSSDPSPLPAG